ncbi:MAG TPA: DUF2339 domain-containing protein [Bryobacteraceae bacterium]|jgi:uncharacterized membrane protein|nr:DUF2339 domain-containing protein [Bryobacteraceae bacterium]
MELLAALCLLVLAALCVALWRRVSDLESRIDRDSENRDRIERQLSTLAGRVYRLENPLTNQTAPVQPPATTVQPPPVPTPEPVPMEEPEPVQAAAFKAEPARADSLKKDDWEALVGGSLLNKLGALVLVVGLALFLAYSFTYMGPGGRAAISALLSVALLAAGIRVERRPRFRTFAYGLIGAGWAGLYATAYAIYALPAARVIHGPLVGSLILFATGAAMVLHSLRYKVQAVTSVAFFTPFAALAVTPSNPFALGSLIPLAAALLFLSWRFDWYGMPIFGLVATWGACISHSSTNASLASSELLLLVYWLLFEIFDLLRIRRKIAGPGLTLLMPLNAIAFVGLSFSVWDAHAPVDLWIGSALAAALFLGDAFARFNIGGQFEPALTLAAAFGGLAILGRAKGLWASAAFAAEAELLFLAGWYLRLGFVRGLGLIAFLVSLIDVAFSSGTNPSTLLPGITVQAITPALLFHTFLFYLNRKIWKPGWYFSSGAAVLLCIVLLEEVSNGYVGLALAAFALILFEVMRRRNLREFRIQFYFVSLASLIALAGFHFSDLYHEAPTSAWISSLGMALACWWVTFNTWQGAGLPSYRERPVVHAISASIGSVLALATFWMILPDSLVALASVALGIAWMELGIALPSSSFALLGAAIASGASVELLVTNSLHGGKAIWLGNGIPFLAGLYYMWFRWRRAGVAAVRLALSLLALLLLTVIVYIEVSGSYRTVVWAIESVALLAVGLTIRERPLRLEGLFLLLACILKLFLYDLRNLETIYRILSFIALGLILLGVSWVYTRFRERLRHYL